MGEVAAADADRLAWELRNALDGILQLLAPPAGAPVASPHQ
jgi:hypothetical protein